VSLFVASPETEDRDAVEVFIIQVSNKQCPDEIVPHKSTSTTLRNTPLTYKHDSAGSFSITGNQLNRVYVRARDYAKLYWLTCPVLFRPDPANKANKSPKKCLVTRACSSGLLFLE
jgi:hypothetical protein